MALRWLVAGGTGNWNSTTNWSTTDGGGSGASFPVLGDDVKISTGFVGSLTVNVSSACTNFDGTGGGAWTLAGSAALAVGGNFALSAAMINNYTGTITFNATTTGNTITSNGKTLGSNVAFNGVDGGWTQADAFNTSGSVTLTNGTFSDGGFTLTSSTVASNNTNTRTFTKTGNWTITGTGTVLNLSSTLTWSDSGSMTFNNASATARTITTASNIQLNDVAVTAGSGDLTTTSAMSARNLNFSGYTGQWLSGGASLRGNLTLGSGMTMATTSGGIEFAGTSGTQTIASNGVQIGRSVTINTTGSTVTLADALAQKSDVAVSFGVTKGAFTDNNQNMTIFSLSSNNSNTRTITKGTGTWSLFRAATVWNFLTTTNLTFTDAGTTKITDSSGATKIFNGGSMMFNNLWMNCGGTVTLTGNNTFNDLKVDQDVTVNFGTAGSTTTISSFTNGAVAGHPVTFVSGSPGTQYTLVKSGTGRIVANYVSVRDSIGSPAHKWYYGQGAVNAGNNTGWEWNSVYTGGGKQRKQAQLEEDQEIQELLDILAPQLQGYY